MNECIKRMLSWRSLTIDEVCHVCDGSGKRTYANSTTWRGGIGAQVLTVDVCDHCWGSGSEKQPWTSWKKD